MAGPTLRGCKKLASRVECSLGTRYEGISCMAYANPAILPGAASPNERVAVTFG